MRIRKQKAPPSLFCSLLALCASIGAYIFGWHGRCLLLVAHCSLTAAHFAAQFIARSFACDPPSGTIFSTRTRSASSRRVVGSVAGPARRRRRYTPVFYVLVRGHGRGEGGKVRCIGDSWRRASRGRARGSCRAVSVSIGFLLFPLLCPTGGLQQGSLYIYIPSSHPSAPRARTRRLSSPEAPWHLGPRSRCSVLILRARRRRGGRARARASGRRVRLRRGGGDPWRPRRAIGSSWRIWRRCRP